MPRNQPSQQPTVMPMPVSTDHWAYMAAHRIMSMDGSYSEYACPGTRRSRKIDELAKIIKESWPKGQMNA